MNYTVDCNGVCLGGARLLDQNGVVCQGAKGMSLTTLNGAHKALLEWQQKTVKISRDPAWTIQRAQDGGWCVTNGHTTVRLEKGYVGECHEPHTRVRIDNKSASNSKSAPLDVILLLLCHETAQHLMPYEQRY